jgi:multidrug efflux pump subunit AcrA (membrane-fusion protein)
MTHLYGVKIAVPPSMGQRMLSGMFAEVTFFTDNQSDVVIVPTEAIQTGVDGSYVYILDADNIAHRVTVETGLVGDGVTEVTSGLAGGEALVTVGQFYLADGSPARVVVPQEAAS